MNKVQVCDSKIKYTLIAAQYVVSETGKGLSQDYYLCSVCNNYHIFTVNKKLHSNRELKTYYQDDKATHKAKMRNKKRPGFKKRR
jgi:hypothetical protein